MAGRINVEGVSLLGEAYNRDIRPLLDITDNLKQFSLQQDVELPNIVVVGDQSSGKTSIIEAISGIQLPRGKGIVTRCPVELQLKRVINKPWRAILEYQTFNGLSEKIEITEPQKVEQNIREAQENMCTGKDVSRELITLRIESPAKTAPDLTLIDLPGIARIAVESQPADICNQIKRIILDHVSNINTVILCVVSANLDVFVNESVNIVKDVDPEGKRTLGVITKPDMADEANKEDVLCLLNNEKIHLEKGFHMVKCRSQKELDEGLSLEESIENEKIFFEGDKYYRTVDKFQLGMDNLSLKIIEEALVVIQSKLTNLKEEISSALEESRETLSILPPAIPEDGQEKLSYLIRVISDVNSDISSCLFKGKYSLNSENLFYEWRKHFDHFCSKIDEMRETAMEEKFSNKGLSKEILIKDRNSVSRLMDFELFERLITDHVLSYKTEAVILIEEIRQSTGKIVDEIIEKHLGHLPLVESNLKFKAFQELKLMTKRTMDRIETIFNEEKLIFTLDATYEREIESIKRDDEKEQASHKVVYTQRECAVSKKNIKSRNLKRQTKRMIKIIECYLKVVHFRLADIIPMAIRQCLHIELCKNLKLGFIMFTTLPGIEAQVCEDEIIQKDRQEIKAKIDSLNEARIELAKF